MSLPNCLHHQAALGITHLDGRPGFPAGKNMLPRVQLKTAGLHIGMAGVAFGDQQRPHAALEKLRRIPRLSREGNTAGHQKKSRNLHGSEHNSIGLMELFLADFSCPVASADEGRTKP